MSENAQQPNPTVDDGQVAISAVEAQMIAENQARGQESQKYDANGNELNPTFEMPEELKGKSAEDLAKELLEAKKLLEEKSKTSGEEDKNPEEAKVEDTKKDEDKKTEDTTDSKEYNVDFFNKYLIEYRDNGGLSEETYKDLSKKGFPKDVVDSYISGQQALADNFVKKFYDKVGSKEAWDSYIEYARNNYNEAQAKALDNAILSGDVDSAIEQAELLMFRANKSGYAVNNNNTRLSGTSAGEGGVKPYNSLQEFQQDTANPNYGRNKEFTRIVDAKYLAYVNRQRG